MIVNKSPYEIIKEGLWHVTSLAGLKGIYSERKILSNQHGVFGYSFDQSKTSKANSNDCIALFDLESRSPNEYEDEIINLQINDILRKHKPLVLINLNRDRVQNIIPFDEIRELPGNVIIGYVECLVPKEISFDAIEYVIISKRIIHKADIGQTFL